MPPKPSYSDHKPAEPRYNDHLHNGHSYGNGQVEEMSIEVIETKSILKVKCETKAEVLDITTQVLGLLTIGEMDANAVFRIADHVRTDISGRPLWTTLLSGPTFSKMPRPRPDSPLAMSQRRPFLIW